MYEFRYLNYCANYSVSGDISHKEGIVKSSSLNEKFYTTLERALNKLKKSQKIYDASHYVIKTLYIIIPFITLTLFGIFKMFYSYKVYLDYNSLYGLNKKIIIFSFIYYLILFIISKKRNKDNYEYYNDILLLCCLLLETILLSELYD